MNIHRPMHTCGIGTRRLDTIYHIIRLGIISEHLHNLANIYFAHGGIFAISILNSADRIYG